MEITKEQTKEYIYLDDEGDILYTSRNKPLKYEEQTDCILIECGNEYDLDRILDLILN